MLSKLQHLIVGLPALIALLLDKTGNLSQHMTEVVEVLTFVFGAAHVASFFHSAALVKATSATSGIQSFLGGVQTLIGNLSAAAAAGTTATNAPAAGNASPPPPPPDPEPSADEVAAAVQAVFAARKAAKPAAAVPKVQASPFLTGSGQ